MPSVVTTDRAQGADADRDPWIEAYLAYVRVERRLAARTVKLYATHLDALQARAAESKLALAQVHYRSMLEYSEQNALTGLSESSYLSEGRCPIGGGLFYTLPTGRPVGLFLQNYFFI